MGGNVKAKPERLCAAAFAFCLAARLAEYFLIETDKTVIGENVLHKLAGIILLAVILKRRNLTWSDIGFRRDGFAGGVWRGLALGIVCFAVAYGLELAALSLRGEPARLKIYISGFSLTGAPAKNTGLLFFALCVCFNIVNVWMEEGLFRGLFLKMLSETGSFLRANVIAALLFGVWHIVMPVRSYLNHEMSFASMVLMGLGYILLSGVMGIKWGLLCRLTGNIWAGLGDHLFNNTVATNMLHVVSPGGADELQIVRILAAQLISFAFVLIIYYDKNRKQTLPDEDRRGLWGR